MNGAGRCEQPKLAFRHAIRNGWGSREKSREGSIAREHEIPESEAVQGRGFLPDEASRELPDPPVVRSFSWPYFVSVGFW
jgi:hypothetical protein